MAAIVHCLLAVKQPPELVGRAYRFSLAALRFYRKLPKNPDAQVPGVQFYKAATSTWSNYRASQRGRSRAEFIAKLGIAVEESDEAVGWLEFLRDGEISADNELLSEAKEICAILTASLTSARNKSR
ncbi:MAG: four helix bundle protein [Vicinamibacterales bacterium]